LAPDKIPNTKLLILTASYFEKVEGRKHFQKAIYILQEHFKVGFTYSFIPYLYGPYSSQLQNDIDVLARTGYLRASKIGSLFFYEITNLGKQVALQIEKEYGKERSENLRKHAIDLKDFETEELVKWSKQLMSERVKENIFW
jgi:uncharacterized protein YwgA